MRLVGLSLPVAAIASLACVACGHMELHEMRLRAPGAFPAQSAVERAPVPIYSERARPSRAFYDVALLQVVGYGADADPDHVLRALLSRAQALACDAVVGVRIDQGWTRVHGFGVCVRWSPLAPQETVPPAQPPNPQEAPASSRRDAPI